MRPPEPYDAFLLVSFGGPEAADDVVPFLENVTRGKNIPRDRLVEVGKHYYDFGGRSPINDQCRELIDAVRADFEREGVDLPIYWGNRNWDPYLGDTLEQLAADGVRRALCLVTSAYASYSGCRQYRENLYDAAEPLGADAPRLDRIRHYFNHPGFVEPFVDATVAALESLDPDVRDDAQLVFVTHSIPETMNAASGQCVGAPGHTYVEQHRDVASTVGDAVAARTGVSRDHELVFCSRSGPPQVPWLEPDVNDHLEALAKDGAAAAVVVPIGFVSDHMEVIYDLDTEAAQTADSLGLAYRRAATPGVDPRFVSMVTELVVERAAVERQEGVERRTTGVLGPCRDVCPADCCANPRGERPALCEEGA
ncbi:ferrochelatase [Solicola gregarius]|uniref:Coproporphyrin III ferrochelatase n=1 Tax=Solicola gregarius TaxID=2908642 RepID=A0AA46YLW7_9ACTN|nr:ferrochelatase [Solicola gregarius]UYM05263.1 ferrochelatase [Solicola gregarius]